MRDISQRRPRGYRGNSLHDSLWRLDHGFSVAIALIAIATTSVLLTAYGTAISLAQFQVKAQLSADAAALVGADTLLGAVAGYPCENAEQIAKADGAILNSCRIVGLGVIVETTQNFGLFEVSQWAEASTIQ